jgi:hypothetical protein
MVGRSTTLPTSHYANLTINQSDLHSASLHLISSSTLECPDPKFASLTVTRPLALPTHHSMRSIQRYCTCTIHYCFPPIFMRCDPHSLYLFPYIWTISALVSVVVVVVVVVVWLSPGFIWVLPCFRLDILIASPVLYCYNVDLYF